MSVVDEHVVDIPRGDGKTLKGTWYAGDGKEGSWPCCIMCHGFTGDRSEWGRFKTTASALVAAGFNALAFDFSGSGENPREPVQLLRQVKDLEAVAGWMASQGNEPACTIGLSFGGITSLLAEIPGRKAAAFWAPGFFMNEIIGRVRMTLARLLLKAPGRTMTRAAAGGPIIMARSFFDDIARVDPRPRLAAFAKPAIIVQGLADTAVKPDMSRRAFSIMPRDERHVLVEVPGATHDFDGPHLDAFIEATVSFFQREITGTRDT